LYSVQHRSSLVLAAVLPLLACTSACAPASTDTTNTGPTGAAGKADGAQPCAAGRTCLSFRSYDVLFTYPVCATYPYDAPVPEVDGERDIAAKPKHVYCDPEFDADASRLREDSPQHRILQWVDGLGSGDEIFLAYLSFSDSVVADALCEAEGRGAEVTMVLDSLTARAEDLQACGGEVLIRGHVGSVGFAHNKMILVNPAGAGPSDPDDDFIKLSFGSGNMSSGTHLHHENWHFLEVARDSFFVQSHQCLMDALVAEEHTAGKAAFSDFMAECRADIDAEPEDDITAYFIPALADRKALIGGSLPSNADPAWFSQPDLLTLIDDAAAIDIGAHRFSATKMIEALLARLSDTSRPFHLRLVADDDLYWMTPLAPSKVRVVGLNSFDEADRIEQLRAADAGNGRFEEAYLETNHKRHLLHHNKFLVFAGMDGRADTVLMGSPNLTGTGFDENLENVYITDIPQVVEAFQAQYALWWDGEGPLPEGHAVAPRATHGGDMPIEIFAPEVPTDDGGPVPGACGIRIAEVVYDAVGSDGGKEWIKLYNSCDEPQPLAGMSLGWGGSSYRTGGLDLAGQLEARGCMIIGGPTSDATNGSPAVDVAADFSPDLQNAGTTADGVAIFAVTRESVTADTIPIDAVVYGETNTSGLLDASGQAPEPHVRTAATGGSLVRLDAAAWDVASTPTPSSCPSF
jgi:hypothetical protein